MVGHGHERPLFVLFGASMTQYSFEPGGWGAALQDLYQRKADVLLRGYSGWNTRRALEAIEKIFLKDDPLQPALVVVFFGANDAALPVPSGKGQAVPIEEFKANLIKIATYLKGLSDTTRVVLVTPPPIHEENRRVFLSSKYPGKAHLLVTHPDRSNERAGQYAAASKAAAKEAGVLSIDLWTAIQKAEVSWGSYLTDGMHMAEGGSKVLFAELTVILKNADWVPSLHWDSMGMDFAPASPYDYVHPIVEVVVDDESLGTDTVI